MRLGETNISMISWPRHALLHRLRLGQRVDYTMTSHVIALPASQGISMLPSGRLPSPLTRPDGSLADVPAKLDR